MIELRDYQKKAVSELKQRIVEMLNEQDDRQRLIFKAPTGSGKTVMVSTVLDELTRDLPVNGQCRYSRGMGVDSPQQAPSAELPLHAQLLQRAAFAAPRDVR